MNSEQKGKKEISGKGLVGNCGNREAKSSEMRLRGWSVQFSRSDSDLTPIWHRPSNVDDKRNFSSIVETLEEIQARIKIVFPTHPRTKKQIENLGLEDKFANMQNTILAEPLGYLDFMGLLSHSKFVLTDSGGIQEETTVLGIPCLTLRKNTERPVTVEEGTNVIVGVDKERIVEESYKILDGVGKSGKVPKLWDGKTAQRIVKILTKWI